MIITIIRIEEAAEGGPPLCEYIYIFQGCSRLHFFYTFALVALYEAPHWALPFGLVWQGRWHNYGAEPFHGCRSRPSLHNDPFFWAYSLLVVDDGGCRLFSLGVGSPVSISYPFVLFVGGKAFPKFRCILDASL